MTKVFLSLFALLSVIVLFFVSQASIEFVQKLVGMPQDRASGLKLAVGPFHQLLIENMEHMIAGV